MDRILQLYLQNEYNKGNYVDDVNEIISILDDINKEFLYKNDFHGLYHSQKTCFFAYLIGKHENLSPREMKILLDAAKYHDTGRKTDYNDPNHSWISANTVDSLALMNVIHYDKPIDLYYLKAIIKAHNGDDSTDITTYSSYLIESLDDSNIKDERMDVVEFKKLSNILKDAIALDHLRHVNITPDFIEGKVRLKYSKELIPVANTVNAYYRKVTTAFQYRKLKEQHDKTTYDKVLCYHGVGFDFFKALSILKNGVVSHYNAKLNNIEMTRNFKGNNNYFWISVVDADSTAKDKEAYNRYVKNGLSFLCYVDELVEGVEKNLDNGSCDPRKPDEYHDERFVFDKIPLENIQFLSIPRKLMDTSIKELPYLYCYSQYEIVSASVNNYIRHIEEYCNIRISRTEIDKILAAFKKEQTNFNRMNAEEADEFQDGYIEELRRLKKLLNTAIQNSMQIGFAELFNKNFDEEITLRDVMKYILDKANIDYSVIDENEHEEDDFMNLMDLPFYKDEDGFLIRLSTFDLNKSNDDDKTI